jgi:hypothetical protein
MPYRDGDWVQRFGTLGDIAESMFEEIAPLGRFVRMGWSRPEISMSMMSANIRQMPDYYTGTGHLIEVMGLGADGILKLKTEKWESLKWWNKSGNEVGLFVWNSSLKQYAVVPWAVLRRLISKARADGIQSFANDGNTYYPIRWEWIAAEAGTIPYEKG